jgi:hypothetical protein
LFFCGITACAIANLRSPQPVFNEEGDYTTVDNYLNFIENNKQADQAKELTGIAVYKEEDLLLERQSLLLFGEDANFYDTLSGRTFNFDAIVGIFPTEAIRDRGDGMIYVVYETTTGMRFYKFFSESDNYRYPQGTPILINNKHSYEEFKNLKVGDSIDEVIKIDSWTSLYKTRIYSPEQNAIELVRGHVKIGNSPLSMHYLSD